MRHGPYHKLINQDIRGLPTEVPEKALWDQLVGLHLSRSSFGHVQGPSHCKFAYRRLRWLGHVASMGHDRMPLQMMFSTMPSIGTRGRQFKSWNDHVREDLKAVGHAYDWWKKCKNREAIIRYCLTYLVPRIGTRVTITLCIYVEHSQSPVLGKMAPHVKQ